MIDRFYIYPYVSNGGRASIAVEYSRETGLVMYGVAWCSPKDQFNRKKGRMIAEGRLEACRGSAFYTQAFTRRELVNEVILDLVGYLDEVNAPQWVTGFEDYPVNAIPAGTN